LQNLRPADANPHFLQTGIAIVTSNRLPSVWKKYRDGILSHQEAMKILSESDDDFDQGFEDCPAVVVEAVPRTTRKRRKACTRNT
jgi:hypothetical protein